MVSQERSGARRKATHPVGDDHARQRSDQGRMGSTDLGWGTTRAVDGRFKFNILQPNLCLTKRPDKRGRSEKKGDGRTDTCWA